LSYFEVSKPFTSFLGKVFAVKVEQNRWQTSFLSKSSSNYHTCLPLVHSCFNTLIQVQSILSAGRYQFILVSALIWSTLHGQIALVTSSDTQIKTLLSRSCNRLVGRSGEGKRRKGGAGYNTGTVQCVVLGRGGVIGTDGRDCGVWWTGEGWVCLIFPVYMGV
jgi:hypothetical protein